MSDRFQFRIFHKSTKTIQYVTQIDFINSCVDTSGIIEPLYSISFDDIELMQATGLRDKNGKLIFEGDIVADEWGDDEMQGTIVYHQETAKFIREFKDGWDAMEELYEPRIIGNIYENSELLGDKA